MPLVELWSILKILNELFSYLPIEAEKRFQYRLKLCVQNVNFNIKVSSFIRVKAILQFSTLFSDKDTLTSGEKMFKLC